MVKKGFKGRKSAMRKPVRRRIMRKKNSYTGATIQTARPQRMLAKLPYFTSGQLYSSAGLYQQQLMNLNSLYDPDRSGVGHQPLGRDEWASWYNRYRVYKVDYIITMTNLDPDQSATVAVINQNGIPTYANESAFEQPGAFVKTVGTRDGNAKVVIKGSVYLPRLNGKTPSAYRANDDTQAQNSANPLEVLTQALVVAPTLAGAEVNIGYSIKYIYHCELFDPLTLGIS